MERLKERPSEHWLSRKERPKRWSPEETGRILEALSELPPALLVDAVEALFRLEKSSTYAKNPAAGRPGEIAVYDPAFDPKENLARVLAHEFAHEAYRQLPNAAKNSYRVAAEWLLVRNPSLPGGYVFVPNRDPEAFVAEDGPETMTEDFSNNVEYFLFEPQVLHRKTPKVYDWIKAKFGDNFKLGRGDQK
ncbi:MAG: hypothetical protein NDJ90_03060 [Oligoflexia bacterium]|nr:hypothetical protein [Oligoflexia bacterium]